MGMGDLKWERAYKDEMAADVGSAGDKGLIGRVEVPRVATLHNEHDDPVDGGDDGVEREGSSQVAVLAPYRVAAVRVLAVGGRVEGVVDAGDDDEEPGEDGQHLEGDEGFSAVAVAFDEGVVWSFGVWLLVQRVDGYMNSMRWSSSAFLTILSRHGE